MSEDCEKCAELREQHGDPENWDIKCPDCGMDAAMEMLDADGEGRP